MTDARDEQVLSEPPTASAATRAAAAPSRHARAILPARVGAYTVGDILGRGGMGVVARGHDESTDARVALKFLDDHAATDDSELLRVEREGRMLSAIRHPHVALLLGVEEVERGAGGPAHGTVPGPVPVLILELVEGETLTERLSRGSLPLDEALMIGAQVASAVAAAHERGIVHRDLKPGNVKLGPRGAKVLDFGLATRAASEVPRSLASETRDLDVSGLMSGTPGYMSPEQVSGEAQSFAADAWALGCILHECLTGHRAFPGETMAARLKSTLESMPDAGLLPTELEPALREAIHGCFAREPARRTPVRELAALLAASSGFALDAPAATAPPAGQRRSLPRARSRFVGRRGELADLRSLACSERLTTLTGAGGSGKTRLALEAGLDLEADPPPGRFGDGIVFVELALAEEDLLAGHVAAALGIADRKGLSARDSLLEFASAKDMLLILDNCEHVALSAAALVRDLLAAGSLSVLATSREPLRLPGERVLALAPLRVPLDDGGASVATLLENESVALFVDRARLARRGFRLDASNAAAVIRCCRRLDGMPLAIELAVARLRHVDAARLAEELDDCFAVLTGGSPAALPRHQALRATIDWSFDQLAPRERALQRRLSVLAGAFSLQLAESVAEDALLPRAEILPALALLHEKSLLQAEPDSAGRWRMLEPIKQHAREKLAASGEEPATTLRHVRAMADLMEQAHPKLDGAELDAGLAMIDGVRANVAAAVHAAAAAGEAPRMLRALGGIGSYFVARSAWREGLALIDSLLPAVPAGEAAARAPALLASAQLSLMLGNASEAAVRGQEARRLCEVAGDEKTLAETLNTLAQVAWERLELDEARRLGEASLALRQRLGLRALATNSLNQLGLIARSAKDAPAARGYFEEALAIQRDVGNDFTRTAVLINLAVATIDMKDHAGARPLLEEALELAVRTGSRRGEVFALINLAQVEMHLGRHEVALGLLRRAVMPIRQAGDRSGAMMLLLGRARCALALGEPALAARCWGAAVGLRDGIGASRFHDQESFERGIERVRELLGDESMESELASGRATSFEAALDLA